MLGLRCCLAKCHGRVKKPELWTLGKVYALFDKQVDLRWVRAWDDRGFIRLLRQMGEGNHMWESNEGSQFVLTLHGGD